MGVVWRRGKAELKASWRSLLLLAVLVGIGGGVAIAAVAGARRTDTAMGRFLAYNRPEDVFVQADGPAGPSILDRVRALPQVEGFIQTPFLVLSPSAKPSYLGGINPFAASDDTAYRAVERPIIVSGRAARPTDPHEVTINTWAAAGRHLGVGDHLRLYGYTRQQIDANAPTGFNRPVAPEGPAYDFTVVGVVRQPNDLGAVPALAAKQGAVFEGVRSVYLTPAFLHEYATRLGVPLGQLPGMDGARVRLKDLHDLPAFLTAVRAIGGDQVLVHPGSDAATSATHTQRSAHLQAVALLVFGVLAAVATILVVGQSLVRLAAMAAGESRTLWALGTTPRQLVGVALIRAAAVGLAGAFLSVVLAIAVSPLTPIGVVRGAEIHPGVEANAAVLLLGGLAVAIVVIALSTLPAVQVTFSERTSTDGYRVRRPSRAVAVAAALSLPPAAVTGLTLRGGRSALGTRTALVATLVAVAGLAASLTFALSVDRLVSSPAQQGWTWDVLVGNPNNQGQAVDSFNRAAIPLLAANPLVAGFTGIAGEDFVKLDGRPVENVGGAEIEQGDGHPPLLQGRAPRTSDEVVLASGTLHQLHRRVGDTVIATREGRQAELRIVGRMLAPSIGDISPNKLNQGAWLTLDGLRRLDPQPQVLLFAVTYARGASRDAAFASLEHDFGQIVLTYLPDLDVDNLHRVRALPFALAGLLVLLGVATTGHALITSVRKRQPELAVLKTLGFRRGQVAATVAWQSVYLAAIALLVGLPLGVIGGSWAWRLVAEQIGSVSPAAVPVPAVVALVPATLIVAVALAAVPGWWATRVSPATALRTP